MAGLIEKMSGFVYPHCGEVTDLFKAGGGETLPNEMKVPFLGRVSLDPTVVQSGDGGKPFVDQAEQSSAAKSFVSIVAAIEKTVSNL